MKLETRDFLIAGLVLAVALLGLNTIYTARELERQEIRIDAQYQWIIGIRGDVKSLEAVKTISIELEEQGNVIREIAKRVGVPEGAVDEVAELAE